MWMRCEVRMIISVFVYDRDLDVIAMFDGAKHHVHCFAIQPFSAAVEELVFGHRRHSGYVLAKNRNVECTVNAE